MESTSISERKLLIFERVKKSGQLGIELYEPAGYEGGHFSYYSIHDYEQDDKGFMAKKLY